jgi:hypothetical protein
MKSAAISCLALLLVPSIGWAAPFLLQSGSAAGIEVNDTNAAPFNPPAWDSAHNRFFIEMNGLGNEWGFEIQNLINSTNSPTGYEKGGLFVSTATFDSSVFPGIERAALGAFIQSACYAHGALCWALISDAYATQPSLLVGHEIDVEDYSGVDQPLNGMWNTTYGLLINGWGRPITVGLQLGGNAGMLHTGLYTDPSWFASNNENVIDLHGKATLKPTGDFCTSASVKAASFKSGSSVGASVTKTVYGTHGWCTEIFTAGLLTGGTC